MKPYSLGAITMAVAAGCYGSDGRPRDAGADALAETGLIDGSGGSVTCECCGGQTILSADEVAFICRSHPHACSNPCALGACDRWCLNRPDTGVDTGVIDARVADTRAHVDGAAHDAVTSVCRRNDAELNNYCVGPRGPPGAFFDGTRCVAHSGHCQGTECEAFASLGECEAATARCKPVLCRTTGGVWSNIVCGDARCGLEDPCDAIIPGCNCGVGRTYRDGAGCVADPECGPHELCLATQGEWAEPGRCAETCFCGSICLPECRPLVAAECQCGEYMQFDPVRGCVPRGCAPETLEGLCTRTGGEWGPFCTNTSCGEPALEPCLSRACACPRGRSYVEGRGCVLGGCETVCEGGCPAPSRCCPAPIPGGRALCVPPDCSTGVATCPPLA